MMSDLSADATEQVFEWPSAPHQRKHGPTGYASYRAYKPWLRDEFVFRCVYCLTRERWFPNGHEEFAVEHISPRAAAPDRSAEYDNLLYSCCNCNRNRQDAELPINPVDEPLGQHLKLAADGTVEWLTVEGRLLVRIRHLNRPLLVQFRQRLLALLSRIESQPDEGRHLLLQGILGFSDDLPNLTSKRPPRGNSRPEGIGRSWFEMRQRGESPEMY